MYFIIMLLAQQISAFITLNGDIPVYEPVTTIIVPVNTTIRICATCRPSIASFISCGNECQFMSMGCSCVNLVALDLKGNIGRPSSTQSHCYYVHVKEKSIVREDYQWMPFIVKKDTIDQCGISLWDPLRAYVKCHDVDEEFIPFICHEQLTAYIVSF